MSELVQSIFGGSSNSSGSSNQAFPWAMQNFGGAASGAYNGGLGALAGILGIGGSGSSGASPGTYFDLTHDGIPGDAAAARAAGQPTSGYTGGTPGAPGAGAGASSGDALSNYFNSAGGQFQLNQGANAINSNMASRGLLNSGADMKGLENYRQGLASTYLQNYIGDLSNYSQLGLGGGNLVTGAGQQYSSQGSSNTNGLGNFLGGALGKIVGGPVGAALSFI